MRRAAGTSGEAPAALSSPRCGRCSGVGLPRALTLAGARDQILLVTVSSVTMITASLAYLVFTPCFPKDADLLDVESKHFEDLEFQQLEHESRLDEEKENLTQQLLREVAEYQRNIVSRKVLCAGDV